MTERGPLPTCPMAETCKRMMENRLSGFTLIVPGTLLILLGVAVLVEPRILLWLVAIAFVTAGIAMLMLPRFIRKIAERFQAAGG